MIAYGAASPALTAAQDSMDTLIPSPLPSAAVAGSAAAARPAVLLILDGFGCRDDAPDNAITRADAPNWRRLLATCPHTTIDASELRVGLPEGQMGNSEVGHLNIGAGRVIYQDYTRIDVAIRDGQFVHNQALGDAVEAARAGDATLHVLGLLSPGGVHSHERQVAAMVDMAAAGGASPARTHMRGEEDRPPRTGGRVVRCRRACRRPRIRRER
jgi:2,3-bisphosphoglycerate-independent phosphoglycerate mutase